MDDSAKVRSDMILDIDLFPSLGLNLNLSDHIMEAGGGSLKEYTSLLIYLGENKLKYLNIRKLKTRNLLSTHM